MVKQPKKKCISLENQTRDDRVKGVDLPLDRGDRLLIVSQKVLGKSQLGASKIRQTNQSVRHE
jgi:hypothetical protein